MDKVTTQIIRSYDVIGIENLNIKGMVKNRKLSRSICDAAMGMFASMLTYKADWYGRTLKVADTFFPSSKLCSGCGEKYTGLKLSERIWTCQKCGRTHDRDENASENLKLLAVGHTVTA
jgi:putative transposase